MYLSTSPRISTPTSFKVTVSGSLMYRLLYSLVTLSSSMNYGLTHRPTPYVTLIYKFVLVGLSVLSFTIPVSLHSLQ